MKKLATFFCMIFACATYATPSKIFTASCTVASTTGSCGALEKLIQSNCFSNTHNAAECQMCSATPPGIALQIYNTAPGGAHDLSSAIKNYCSANGGSNAAQCFVVFKQLLISDKCIRFG